MLIIAVATGLNALSEPIKHRTGWYESNPRTKGHDHGRRKENQTGADGHQGEADRRGRQCVLHPREGAKRPAPRRQGQGVHRGLHRRGHQRRLLPPPRHRDGGSRGRVGDRNSLPATGRRNHGRQICRTNSSLMVFIT